MAVVATDTNFLLDAALKLAAKGIPSFPTDQKMPCVSNKEAGVAKGMGGFKLASTDPDRLKELFSHPRAAELSIPMGSMSGLLAVDVDLYKNPELAGWVEDNKEHLDGTRCHRTRSGGLHFFFKHPGDNIKFPSTLRAGVDLKAGGNGYCCFPPTDGYAVINSTEAKDFPMVLLEEAMRLKGGTGSVTVGSTYNKNNDDELVAKIQSAEDLYPALRTLSFRLAMRGEEPDHIIGGLEHVMDKSVAADPQHHRHDDWLDRKGRIPSLVESAIEKQSKPIFDEEAAKMLSEEESLIDTDQMLAAGNRPVGPQRETKVEDIEAIVADIETSFETFDAKTLSDATLEAIRWTVPGMIPEQGTVSLGGTSNVGKTRWLAALAALGASGKTELMGLPEAPAFTTLWMANEERVEDIKRRIKATFLQHGIKKSESISVRGKDQGMLRLVAINEAGTPEIDAQNIAVVVAEARRIEAKMIFFDPYVTLSDAMDENSATSAAMLTKAFLLITELTGAAVLHAHHTPKDRSKDHDWYRGDSGAWRGSGAIYSALDCGYTLAHWMPKDKNSRKSWKENFIDLNLSRWIVLDTGKIREGRPLAPVVYELVGQDMAEGEGDQIGVCRQATETEAKAVLMDMAAEVITINTICDALIDTLGIGTFSKKEVIKRMFGVDGWPVTTDNPKKRGEFERVGKMLAEPVPRGDHELQFTSNGKDTGTRWKLEIRSIDDADG